MQASLVHGGRSHALYSHFEFIFFSGKAMEPVAGEEQKRKGSYFSKVVWKLGYQTQNYVMNKIHAQKQVEKHYMYG